MSKIQGTNNTQTAFLRAFRTHPGGPPPELWPSPAILRRWLRRPAFVSALASIREALRIQTDFHLSSAANLASQTLAGTNLPESPNTINKLSNLLRVAHLRERFGPDSTATHPPQSDADNSEDDQDDTDDSDDYDDPPEEYDIRKIDIDRRLTDQEFKLVAARRNYSPPLAQYPSLPIPAPSDSPYYKILSDPTSLLWFLHLYDQAGNDHRFSPILCGNRHLLPNHDTDKLPRLATSPPNQVRQY